MYVYAIREKNTNFYMPAHSPSKSTRTFSRDEPKEDGGKYGPRLFPSLKSVQNSLTNWLKGIWSTTIEEEISYDSLSVDYVPVTDVYIKTPHRRRENMEIVRFELREVEYEEE